MTQPRELERSKAARQKQSRSSRSCCFGKMMLELSPRSGLHGQALCIYLLDPRRGTGRVKFRCAASLMTLYGRPASSLAK